MSKKRIEALELILEIAETHPMVEYLDIDDRLNTVRRMVQEMKKDQLEEESE